MKVAITEIFCEVITGIAMLLVLVGFFVWWELITLQAGWVLVQANLNGVTFVALVVAAYLIGVVVDAVGLIFDDYFGHFVAKNVPTEEETKKFWSNVDAHVLAYRDQVWAYYFCYRNLFILSVPGAICWGFVLCNQGAYGWLLLFVVLMLLMAFVMFASMRVLLHLYYDITRSF